MNQPEHHQHNIFKAEIVTPEGIFYAENVHMMVMPGVKGEFGVLVGHVASVVGLKSGLVTIYNQEMQVIERIFITTGFVEITEQSAIILVEQAANLAEYNLSDSVKLLAKLNEDLNFCKNDSEIGLVQKEIQEIESLIEILKRL